MNRIRQIRKSRNLSQQDIANKLDVNQTSVSQWERGVTMPNISTLSKLCEILETSSDYLLGISDDVITKQWEDKSTVDDIEKVIQNIIKTSQKISPDNQKILYNILIELSHILNIRNTKQKNACLSYLKMIFSKSTQFIDVCIVSSISEDIESNRIIQSKNTIIDTLNNSLNELSEKLLIQTQTEKEQ